MKSIYSTIAERNADRLSNAMNISKDSRLYDELLHGCRITVMNAGKTLLLGILAAFLGVVPQVLVFMAAYGALRLFSFGFHLKTRMACTIVGLVYYLGSVFLSMYIGVSETVQYGIFLFAGITFILRSPVPSPQRPIPQSQRKQFRFGSILTLCMMILLSVSLPAPYGEIITMAVLCQTINLLPFEKLRSNNSAAFSSERNIPWKPVSMVKNKLAELSKRVSWKQVWRISYICGCFLILAGTVFYQLLCVYPFWHNEAEVPESIRKTLDT